jgi:predicted RNA-binding protein with EMAP domain
MNNNQEKKDAIQDILEQRDRIKEELKTMRRLSRLYGDFAYMVDVVSKLEGELISVNERLIECTA